jgi:hypothetical protein
MKLDQDWKNIARKAWSIRLGVLAAILTGCEVILPLYGDRFQRGDFALLSFVVVCAALIARLVAQKGLDK